MTSSFGTSIAPSRLPLSESMGRFVGLSSKSQEFSVNR